MICPNCQNTVDPLRAPAAKIRNGKVMTFCSPECARGEPSVSLARAAPAAPVALPEAIVAAAPVAAPAPEIIESAAPVAAPVSLPPPAVREYEPPRRSRRGMIGAAIGTLVAAAIGGAIVQSVSPGRSTPAAASVVPAAAPPVEAPAPLVAAAPAPPSKPEMLARATATLEGYLADTSPRLRREAAMALSRTGHAGALEELIKQLDSEPSEVTKVAIADSLAKAGHARGREFLIASLANPRRDIRMNAAIALAQLADDKARSPLKSWLTLPNYKLSAAGTLALLGDADGIAVLKEALAARDPEPRMRAAAALGKAGDASGKELLLQMIADPRYDQLAATALARLGEMSAAPVLTKVLVLSSLSVEAAIGLRRLGVDPDLAPLASVLEHGDEVARIAAAEAVIVLCDAKRPTELR
jgi:HEAT repeat protein